MTTSPRTPDANGGRCVYYPDCVFYGHHVTAKAAELWDAAECCWTGTGCIHDDETECADVFWALAKRLKSEAADLR